METIKEILIGVVHTIEDRRGAQGDIETLWQCAAYKRLSRHTSVRKVKGTILFINVENPAWLNEVRMRQGQIEKKLIKLSHNKIKSIRARVGDIHG